MEKKVKISVLFNPIPPQGSFRLSPPRKNKPIPTTIYVREIFEVDVDSFTSNSHAVH